MPKKQRGGGGGDIPEWVVTYGDLMSLLLCFFILLAAFSELKQPREYRELIEKIHEAFGIDGGIGQILSPDDTSTSNASLRDETAAVGERKAYVNTHNENNTPGDSEKVQIVQEGNWHTVGMTIDFLAGDAELPPDAIRMLTEEVAPRIKDRTNIVRIVGHAWGYQDEAAGGPGGGVMLMAYRRAQVVHDALVREAGIDPQVLRIESAGDREPIDLPTYSDAAGGANRRVQIYLTDRTVDQVHPDPLGTGRGR